MMRSPPLPTHPNTLPNQAANPVVPTLPVVEVNVPLLEVAATIAAVRCSTVHMGSPVVAWTNEEATSSMDVFDVTAS